MHYSMSIPREQAMVRPSGQPRPKGKPMHGQFDPDELSRRLYIVLAEQKEQADRRRKARHDASRPRDSWQQAHRPNDAVLQPPAIQHKDDTEKKSREVGNDLIAELRRSKITKQNAKNVSQKGHPSSQPEAKSEPGEYHHVPKEAARQFALTATNENMQSGLVHQLSVHALKIHMDTALLPVEQDVAMRRELGKPEKAADRTQFRNSRIVMEAGELDEERRKQEQKRRNRHTFEGEPKALLSEANEYNLMARRSSVGDILDKLGTQRSILIDPNIDPIHEDTTPEEVDRFQAHEHRVDWTQSDEVKHRPRPLLTPLLRKADSIWALRGRLGSKGSQDKEDQQLKSPKSGFFAKLRR